LSEIERLISGRFDELAATAMFPRDVSPDDFELRAALAWLGDVRSSLILDLGCARGRFVRALSASGARVVGVDRSWELLRTALDGPGGGSFVLSTATRLPFADSIFDGIVCIEVIEHIPELGAALSEIARVLMPGGRAIIIDKNPIGVGYHRFYPNWLFKAVMEWLDRWSYPKGFPFKEQWPTPWSVRRKLRSRFARAEIRYLDGRVQGLRRLLLGPLFKLVPALRPDVAWCCQR
jgi:ubiquinone/menaquinone biosynthesis C-methylase UbiE